MDAVFLIRRRAFTLAEILTVIVIIGIAAAVIVPQMASRDDLKVAAAARIMMADLIYAQNMAITQQSNLSVQFDTTNANYSLVNPANSQVLTQPVTKDAYTMTFGASGTPGLREAVLNEVKFYGADGVTEYTTLGFDELGTPLAYPASGPAETLTAGHVRVQSGGQVLQIDIEPFTGHISVGPSH